MYTNIIDINFGRLYNNPMYTQENHVTKEFNGIKFDFKIPENIQVKDNKGKDNKGKKINISAHILYRHINIDETKIYSKYPDFDIFLNYIYLNFESKHIVFNIDNFIKIENEEDKNTINIYIDNNNNNEKPKETEVDNEVSKIKKLKIGEKVFEIKKDDFFIIKNNVENKEYKINYYYLGGICSKFKDPEYYSINYNDEYYLKNHGDGNCLFNAFAQIFYPYNYYKNYNNKIEEHQKIIKNNLTIIETEHFKLNKENYLKYIPEKSKKLREIVTNIYNDYINADKEIKENFLNTYFKDSTNIERDIFVGMEENEKLNENYINKMARDKIYGTDKEFRTLAKFFDLNCYVIRTKITTDSFNLTIRESTTVEAHLYPFFVNYPIQNPKYKVRSILQQDNNGVFYYPYIFCNSDGSTHYDLKKHYCPIEYENQFKNALEKYKTIFPNTNLGHEESKDTNDDNDNEEETTNIEIANIIKAIDVFINNGSSLISSPISSSSNSRSSSRSSSPSNSRSSSRSSSPSSITSSSTSRSSSSINSVENYPNIDITKNIKITEDSLENFFMKKSYIITNKIKGKKYLFAELGPPAPAPSPPSSPPKTLYEDSNNIITEFWQNKTINLELTGYYLKIGEEYFVVPIDDDTINKIK
jgi:hypothetical protein